MTAILLTDDVCKLFGVMTHAAHVNRFADFARTLPACSEQVQRASINGAVPASFLAQVWDVSFYNFGESGACCGKSGSEAGQPV